MMDKNNIDANQHLHYLRSDEKEKKVMRFAICVSLYITLALIWLPGFSFSSVEIIPSQPIQPDPIHIEFLQPPEEVQVATVKDLAKKSVPMPDMDPDSPEPVVAPDELEEIDLVESDDWALTTPDGPPVMHKGPLTAAMPGVEAPVIIKRVKPNYPRKAAKVRITGYVIVQAILKADGTVGDVKVLRQLGKGKFGFEEEAIKAMRQWEFIPGKFRGKPHDIMLSLRIDFRFN